MWLGGVYNIHLLTLESFRKLPRVACFWAGRGACSCPHALALSSTGTSSWQVSCSGAQGAGDTESSLGSSPLLHVWQTLSEPPGSWLMEDKKLQNINLTFAVARRVSLTNYAEETGLLFPVTDAARWPLCCHPSGLCWRLHTPSDTQMGCWQAAFPGFLLT